MPSSGEDASTRSQLIKNAEFINLPDRRFLERMQPQARQEVRYGLKTSCEGVDLNITILASGVMSLEACIPYAYVEAGRLVTSREPETVAWSDTGEKAMIPTGLGRRHLQGEVTAELVIDAFLGAFGTHTAAAGDYDYSHWHQAMELYANVIAAETGKQVEIIHHLPLMTPYFVDEGGKSPLTAEATCHIYSFDDDDPEEQIQYRSPVMKIQKLLQPEAMDLVLHLPTSIVRRQHRAMFQASPDSRSLAEHVQEFTAHMRSPSESRKRA
ncbi:hypothetical protein [Sphingomonas sp. 3-13AW]|uniref:hypothetical protein n=1 Tax=Sphingomonas sp. 3-13AW TaxID=3050450 RepID=UPI003BB5904A